MASASIPMPSYAKGVAQCHDSVVYDQDQPLGIFFNTDSFADHQLSLSEDAVIETRPVATLAFNTL